MKHYLLNHQPQKGLQAACAQQGQAPTCNARGKGRTPASPATLTKVILVLLTMFLIPSAAWGQESLLSGKFKVTEDQSNYTYKWCIGSDDSYYWETTFNAAASNDVSEGVYCTDNSDTPQLIYKTPGDFNAPLTFTNKSGSKSEEIIFKLAQSRNKHIISVTISLDNISESVSINGESFTSNDTGDKTLTLSQPQLWSNDFSITLSLPASGSISISTIKITTIEAYLGVTVAGVYVTNANHDDVLGDGKVSFTAANGTNPAKLTLTDASISSDIISSLEALTINLEGTNTLSGSISYSGSASNRTLAFTGDGSLEISRESGSPISAFTSVNFGDFNLASQSAPGIHWESQGGSLRGLENIEARDVTITTDTYYPIWIYDSSLGSNAYASHTQLNSDKLSVAVGNGTVSFDGNHTITINGASINSGSNKMIVVGPDMPELTVHLVGASTGTDATTILYLWNTPQLTFTTDESNAGSLTAPLIAYWYEGSGQISCENGLVYNAEANPQTISTTGVRLKIGNTEVSASGSITNIDGASFDATYNTLTLTQATITEAIASNVNLTIVINGKNSISSEGVAIMSNDGNLTLTFQKGGEGASLRLTSSNSDNGVISAFKSVTADGMRIMGINATDNSTYKAIYDSSSKTLVGENKQPVTAATIFSFLDGQGTEASPYLIKTAADLASVSAWVNNGTLTTEYLQLANDIDCSSLSDFTPIGTNSNYSFAGTFDGNNKTISGLNCTPSGGDAGLFGSVGNANISSTIIKNLNLDNCTFNGADAGAIAITLNNGIIQGCHVTSSSVTSHQQSPKAGGIVASLGSGSIEGCSVSESTVTGKQENSINNGVSYAGGIVGSTGGGSTNSGSINNCEVTNVNIISSHFGTNGDLGSGGIVGYASSTTITNNTVGGTTTVTCENKNSTAENHTNAGAIVGYHDHPSGSSGCTFNSNTYESSVKTITKEYDNTEETKEGQTQRGIGNDSDEIGKIELAGTKSITIGTSVEDIDGVYSYYLNSYNSDNKTTTILALPGENVVIALFSEVRNDETVRYTITNASTNGKIEATIDQVTPIDGVPYTKIAFTMPDADVKIDSEILGLGNAGTFGLSDSQPSGTYYNGERSMTLEDGIVGYVITGVSGASVTMTRVSYIPKGVPVYVKMGTSEETPTEEVPASKLKYATETVTGITTESKLFVLYKDKFVKVTSGTDIPARKCYLDLSDVTAAGTRGFYYIEGGDDGTTAIREVRSGEAGSEKTADGGWHDMQGRKLTTKPAKGLYIRNGKKVVVK